MARVLLAGEVSNRDALATALSDAGLSVVRAEDAVAAVERLEATAIDCVLLGDPDPDAFVRDLQRRGYDVPVLVDAARGRAMTFEAEGVVDTDAPEQVVERVEGVVTSVRIDRELAVRRRREAAVAEAREALADAGSEDALDALCERLAAADSYAAAWLGRHDVAADAVVPRAWAGVPETHLGAVPAGADAEGATARAVSEGAVAVETDGDHAFLAVPVGDAPRAVLHLYARRPDGVPSSERELLADLGDAIDDRLSGGGAEAGDDERLSVLGDTLAHELGNQLDLASLYLGLARDEDDESHLDQVEDALHRMSDLADDARSLARGELSLGRVRVHDAATDAWQAVESGDATLRTDRTTVRADRDLLELLLENLFRNAVEHGSPSPPSQAREDAVEHGSPSTPSQAREDAVEHGGDDVTVTVGPHDDGFYVADDGPGIPEDEREQVFDWGYSATGTGVGLGIVSLVAERHGWTVELTESEDGGARFEFA